MHLTCLHRVPSIGQSTLIQCYTDLAPERYVTTLGDVGPLDASARPSAGDSYVLTWDGGVAARAGLVGIVWVPVARR